MNGYLLAAITVMAVATFATRALPFLMLSDLMDRPLVRHLGRYLPPAVMLLLVIYAVRDVEPLAPPHGLHELAAIAVTALAHVLWRNALASIALGTGTFMALLHFAPAG
ncbi:branched-chain amino acid transporter permease [Arhodomonas sp. SL1]|uniref:branched-chain amino acid transporter permease n=1 Tax=Arhodomonas sp. SL1 TaxID=3425691 RepID=UPI003F880A58